MPFDAQGFHNFLCDFDAFLISLLDEKGFDLQTSVGICATDACQHTIKSFQGFACPIHTD